MLLAGRPGSLGGKAAAVPGRTLASASIGVSEHVNGRRFSCAEAVSELPPGATRTTGPQSPHIHFHPLAFGRLLMLTGFRLSKIQKLPWEYVDLGAGELRLPDARSARP